VSGSWLGGRKSPQPYCFNLNFIKNKY